MAKKKSTEPSAPDGDVRPNDGEKPAQDGRKTPREWAQELGYWVGPDRRRPQNEPHFRPEHAAADRLHRWSEHAHHYQLESQQFRLSEADYRKALACASQYPLVRPHMPAVPDQYRAEAEKLGTREPTAKAAKRLKESS